MSPSAELSWRRFAAALLLLAFPSFVLLALAQSYERLMPPRPPDYSPLSLHREPLLDAVQRRELGRSNRMAAKRLTHAKVMLFAPSLPDPLPTIVLAARSAPYTLSELRHQLPAAFKSVGSALLLRASIEVPQGSRLEVESATTPNLLLTSSPNGFASITSHGGVIAITGTPKQRVRIASWNEPRQTPDTDVSDGRSFITTFGGRMNIKYADISGLGFNLGVTSGVAWRGQALQAGGVVSPARGNVEHSIFHNNWFGAFTWEARGMQWTGNTFADNMAYGFDPHDFSSGFSVVHNVARGNGRHGFIFSRGCNGNLLDSNVSYNNRGHGFMIDDGRSENSEARSAGMSPSNDNVISNNRAYDNDGSGVEIEGGSGNLVRGNSLERNHVGVRLKNGASASVVSNHIRDNRLYGVHVLAGSGNVRVEKNHIVGGYASVAVGEPHQTTIIGNVEEGAASDLVIDGQMIRRDRLATRISRTYNWHPLLLLWTSVLGLPFITAWWYSVRRWHPSQERGSKLSPWRTSGSDFRSVGVKTQSRRATVLTASVSVLLVAAGAVMMFKLFGDDGSSQPSAARPGTVTATPTHAPTATRSEAPMHHLTRPHAAKQTTPPSGQGTKSILSDSKPEILLIPSVRLRSTDFVDIHVTSDGSFQVPNSGNALGFYTKGPAPGEPGPAVMMANGESVEGTKVLHRLRAVEPGAKVYVTRHDRLVATFVVETVATYPKGHFPSEVLNKGDATKAEIRLVTCGGMSDRVGRCLENVVIFGRLTGLNAETLEH